MICYRSIIGSGSSAADALNYTVTVNGKAQLSSCYGMFAGQTSFNEPVIIGNNVKNCANMFRGCSAFNSPVTFGKRTNNYYAMFSGCSSFNQSIVFSEYADNCVGMLALCSSFNRPITLPNNVYSCSQMLAGCTNYNHDTIIPKSVNNIADMFKSINGSFNIYVNGDSSSMNVKNMFNGKNNHKRINVFANGFGHFYATNTESVIGQFIGWSYDTNCIYNTDYNIYIYNNYIGT